MSDYATLRTLQQSAFFLALLLLPLACRDRAERHARISGVPVPPDMKIRKASFLLGLLLFSAGCASSSRLDGIRESSANIEAQVLDFPAGDFNAIWLPNNDLLITPWADTYYAEPNEPITYLLLSGDSLNVGHFPIDNRCWRMAYFLGGILPDGRLGLIQDCQPVRASNMQPNEALAFVMAFDWRNGDMEQLVDKSLPPIWSFPFSWNPGMTRGVQEAGSLLGTIHWITPQGAEPMDVTIRDGRRHWSLADNYWRMLSRSGESQDIGIACCGAWSPNGEQIGFFASADALGHEGIDRAQGEYKLYLMNSDRLEPEPILNGVYYANQLAWSPDGQWLAFTGQRHGSSGVWLFSPQERLLVRVTNDPIQSFSWSPDGSKLAATRYCEGCRVRFREVRVTTDDGEEILIPECNPFTCRQLVIYDVSTVLHNP